MADFAEHLAAEQCFAKEYEDQGTNRLMANIVAFSGVSVEMLETLHQSPFFARGFQNCFQFERLD